MRWKDERRSENVEDRRGVSAGVAVGGGIGTLILVLVAMFLGADPRQVLNLLQNNQQAAPNQAGAPVPGPPAEEERKDFVSVVLAETEDVWEDVFKKMNKEYVKPTLHLFRDGVASACGNAEPGRRAVLLPSRREGLLSTLASFRSRRIGFKAPGDLR